MKLKVNDIILYNSTVASFIGIIESIAMMNDVDEYVIKYIKILKSPSAFGMGSKWYMYCYSDSAHLNYKYNDERQAVTLIDTKLAKVLYL